MPNKDEKRDVGTPTAVAEAAERVAVHVDAPAPAAACKHEKCSCKLAVEFWAEKHGMLPEVHTGGALALPAEAKGQRSVRVSMAMSGKVAPRHNGKYVHFYAAKLHNRWPIGHECTEAEFLAACKKAYGPDAEVICR